MCLTKTGTYIVLLENFTHFHEMKDIIWKPQINFIQVKNTHPEYLSLDTIYSLNVELSLYYLIFALRKKMIACWNRMITSADKYLCIFFCAKWMFIM